jgi:hypothetical protein
MVVGQEQIKIITKEDFVAKKLICQIPQKYYIVTY